MISIHNLIKSYGSQKVLRSITMDFESGQSIALIGPNGSGKTTLIKMILSLVKPDEGEVFVGGVNIKNSGDYRRDIGYMPQMTRYPENMTVRQLFHLVKSLRPDVPSTSYDLDLYHSFDIDSMSTKALHALSGGMKQKVSAALAFLFDPNILILDEPTAGLDPVSNETLKEKIRSSFQKEKLVLITSHILNDLDEIVNQVVYLMEGRIVFNKHLEELRRETDETRLNKIIVTLLQQMEHHVEN